MAWTGGDACPYTSENVHAQFTESGLEEAQVVGLLVRRCVSGDAAAWEEIVQTYTRRIYNLALDEFIEWYGREPRACCRGYL